ncbi:hypothetical protein, partial [Enterococcus faecium]|uniref:hypothetical protein n=1 Tax=Enterococcus faecium TaxID=1352 RepID=UPI0023B214F6
FILYNTVGLHFENAEYEKEFYTNKLNVNYRYKNIILSLLLKNHSQINFESIQVITAKLEGSLNFFPLLYPYYRLYQESLVSKKLENQNHKDLIEIIEFDVASTDELHLEGNHKKIDLYKYLTFILSDFLKKQDRQKVYRIGIYSRKGVIFEQQLAVDLKKSIEILPYYDYEINENNENTGNIDLLLV